MECPERQKRREKEFPPRPAALGAVPAPVAEIKVRVELRCALMRLGQWPVGLAGSQPQPRGGACMPRVGRAGVAESRRRRDSWAAQSVQAAQKVGEFGEIFLAPCATLSSPCVALLPIHLPVLPRLHRGCSRGGKAL